MVPFLDLKRQYERMKEEIDQAVQGVFQRQSFILGDEVRKLEGSIAERFGAGHAIGVSSGTDALLISLMALGIREGNEVITSPFTFFATAGAIYRLGAIPVFVDIDSGTFNMNPDAIEAEITERTVCIIPVHLFGLMADMERITETAKRYNLHVVEDAAQAIGAWQRMGKTSSYAGTIGITGCFSFFPTKNLGGAGDGGMVVTGDPIISEKIRRLRVHGSYPKYYHQMVGLNGRLDEIQAAVLNVKLKYLDGWTRKRREHAEYYVRLYHEAGLEEFGVSFPTEPEGFYHVYNQFTGRFPNRDQLVEFLTQRGFATAVYYPLPLHLQPCFALLGYRKGDFPQAEKAAEEALSLPIFPELTRSEQERVILEIRNFYEKVE